MTQIIQITEDAFAVLFRPIQNPFQPEASYNWGRGFGTMFDTGGEDFDFILKSDSPDRIWTILPGESGDYICSGFYRVNRMGYFITEVPVHPNITIHVELKSDDGSMPKLKRENTGVNIELSEDAFGLLLRPIKNPLNSNASFDWGDGFGTIFETYGDELAFVQRTEPDRVWTLLSGDDGDVICNGFWRVNRLGYFITEVAVPLDVNVQVELPSVEDNE